MSDYPKTSSDPLGLGPYCKNAQILANQTQIGGDHYKKPIQAWDYIAANSIGFFEGNAIKYLTRWKEKGGVEDLKKARHYIDKLIELQG